MILCVIMVSMGGYLVNESESKSDDESADEDENERIKYLIATLMSAVAAGLAVSLNSIHI